LRTILPGMERLSQLLRVESVLSDAPLRQEAQALASRLHTPMQQLYSFIIFFFVFLLF